MHRAFFASSLLALITANIAMTAVGVAKTPAFFSQPGSRTYVLEPVCALLAYTIAVIFIARTRGPYWDSILRAAIVFGVLTATLEVINIVIENGIPLAPRGPALPIGFMLSIFMLWGTAGFRTARSLRSTRAGLFAAVSSAGICMVIAVAAGFIIQFFLFFHHVRHGIVSRFFQVAQ